LTIAPDTGLISGTIADDVALDTPIVATITATDGTYSNSQAVLWYVEHPDDQAPTLTNPGDQTTIAGAAVSLALAASDADGDTLSYSADGLPDGFTTREGCRFRVTTFKRIKP
jgi:hypothetical protein